MPIPPNIAIRFSEPDKAALIEVARLMQMSQSETLRMLVREKLEELNKNEQRAQEKEQRRPLVTL